jgi:uncharacterized protein (TIGR03437 family)
MRLTPRLLRYWSHRCTKTSASACLVLACCPALFAQAGGYLITPFAGNGVSGFSGDNGQATSAGLEGAQGIAVDSAGNIYIADGNRIRKVSNGVITTVAGNGTSGYAGDNGPATSAQLSDPQGVAVDSAGNIYIADTFTYRIRKVSNGVITTVAGDAREAFGCNAGPATSTDLSGPSGVAVDSAGNIYIADGICIQKVSNGVITIAATPVEAEGGSIAVDSAGNLYVGDTNSSSVRKVSNGVITTVAGNGTSGYAGDNGPATSAQLNSPFGVAVDSAGNLYIADSGNNRVRKVSNGVITTVAGGAQKGFSLVVGGPATSADVRPVSIAVDASGNLFIADANNARIWKLVATPQSTLGCLYSIDRSVLSIGASGGSTGVGVLTSGPGCPWLAGSDAGWISGGFGVVQTGTAELTFTVAPNTSSVARSGTIWAAGQTLTVNQAGVACSSSVSPLSVAIPGSGVTGASLSVTSTFSDCPWTAVSSEPWILVSGGSTGSGNGTVTFTVGVNTGAARAGTITVAGQTVEINQAAAGGGVGNITATPFSLDLGTYQAGGANPSPGTVNVSGGGQVLSFSAQVTSGSNWLSVSPTSGTTPTTGSAALTVTATPGSLVAGSYNGTILVSGTGAATGSASIAVTLTVAEPRPTIKGVTNAASYATGAVSPGELVTLFGTAIGPVTAASATTDPATGKLATTIGGVQALFNGVAAPMIYASSTQVSAVVPYEMAPVASPSVWIKYAGQTSNAYQLTTTTTAPGLFTQNASGSGPGAILNQDNSVNGPGNRAAKGSIVQVYLTGEGQTSPASVTGAITTASLPPPQVTAAPLLAVGVLINGQPALYVYAGEAPGLVAGMMQLNVQIPANAPSGDLPILVLIGGNISQSNVTVSVR